MFNPLWILVLVPSLVIAAPSNSEKDMKGPVFIKEPDNRIDFSNSTGSVVECRANGIPSPEIIWVRSDGTAVGDVRNENEITTKIKFNRFFHFHFRCRDCVKFYQTEISFSHLFAPRTTDKRFMLKSTPVWQRTKLDRSFRGTFTSELVR